MKMCRLWLLRVVIIMVIQFNYCVFILFEFYTLVFLYLVMNDGSSYERGGANVYLIIFGYVMRFRFVICNNLIMISLLLLLLGMTKLPIYRLHIWLPKVHVEASMLGSIILAGGVLKLGILYYWNFGMMVMVGLLVIYSLMNLMNVVDRKRFAAYSSVIHITCCVLLGLIIILLVRYIHIVLSPLIFITVYLRYVLSGSRMYLKSGLIMILLWIVNFGIPFFGRFFAEVYLISYIRIILWILIVMYLITGVVIIKSINNNVGSRLIYLPWFVLYIIVI